ncbi:unnamed protein product, partial [Musa textilis]
KNKRKRKGKKTRKTQKLFSLIQTVSHLRLDQIFSEFFCDFLRRFWILCTDPCIPVILLRLLLGF